MKAAIILPSGKVKLYQMKPGEPLTLKSGQYKQPGAGDIRRWPIGLLWKMVEVVEYRQGDAIPIPVAGPQPTWTQKDELLVNGAYVSDRLREGFSNSKTQQMLQWVQTGISGVTLIVVGYATYEIWKVAHYVHV